MAATVVGDTGKVPVEPAPSDWRFPAAADADGDLVGVGADLAPGTVLAAYRAGLFPMPVVHTAFLYGGSEERPVLGWWSPDPRGVIPLDGLNVSRSLRRSLRRYEVRVNTAFPDVIDACADPSRPHGWITPAIRAAFVELHEMGWTHSVETWSLDDGSLAGGLYGVAIGGLFAGESMFSHQTDASKVALVHLVSLLQDGGAALLDVQWVTPHLERLGAREIPRAAYLEQLAHAIERPLPAVFG